MSVSVTWNKTPVALFNTGAGESPRNFWRHSYTLETQGHSVRRSNFSSLINHDYKFFFRRTTREELQQKHRLEERMVLVYISEAVNLQI